LWIQDFFTSGIKKVASQYQNKSTNYIINKVKFDNGTSLNADDLIKMAVKENGVKGTSGDDTLFFEYGSLNVMNGLKGNDTLFGSSGNDNIYGGLGNDKLYGDLGDDKLYGNSGADFIVGGKGNDFLDGSSGNDIYFFQANFGKDIIFEKEINSYYSDNKPDGTDAVEFGPGIEPSSIELTRVGETLVIKVSDSEDELQIKKYFAEETCYHIEEIRFASGEVWEESSVKDKIGTPVGTSANDDLTGFDNVDDEISGLEGDDTIWGGSGSDHLSGNDGLDKIEGCSGNDTIFGNAGSDDLFGNSGDDTIDGGLGSDTINGGDGSDEILGGDGDDQLTGGKGSDNISGNAGSDTISGGSGNDILSGGSGNDSLSGNAGDDILSGGSGADTLDGFQGNDIYRFEPGFGQDIIFEKQLSYYYSDSKPDGTDAVEFGPGIEPSSIELTRVGETLVIKVSGSEDELQIKKYFAEETCYHIEEIRFASGEVWEESSVKDILGTP
jgi:Ca2+-binding RTX toxin-like protein